MLFRLRVDEVNADVQQQLIRLLLGREYVLVKHVLPHGNPHFHAYADLEFNSCQALRYRIDKLCKTTASERSVTECDSARKDEYIQYLFNTKHGNKWHLVSSSMDVTQHQANASLVAEEFEVTRPPKEKKPQGPTMWDMAMETHQTYMLTHVKVLSDQFPSDIHREYARCAIQVCRKHKKGFCDYTLHKIVQTAMAEHEPYRELVVNAVVRRLKPREEFPS